MYLFISLAIDLNLASSVFAYPTIIPSFAKMSNGQVITIGSTEAFDTLLGRAGSLPIVIDFTATWCESVEARVR
jgi:thiol:disulfide interchange protein